jgi:hypothetical protein
MPSHCPDPDEGIHALGWHDHRYDLRVQCWEKHAGSNGEEEEAKGRRVELLQGAPTTGGKGVALCWLRQNRPASCQHLLGLEKRWTTQKWKTRMLHSVLVSMTVVDAFLLCAALLPDRGLEDADGSMDTFITKLVAQMLPPVPIIERTVHAPGADRRARGERGNKLAFKKGLNKTIMFPGKALAH